MPIIIGSPRSGTTLLRLMLDAHSNLAIQPETGFRLFYAMYAARFGKSRWEDNPPIHTHYLLNIQDVLPEAYFIHIIRDGRDVAPSLRGQWFPPGHDITVQTKY